MNQALKYIPFETIVDTAFWHVLATRKLEEYRLSEGPFPLTAEYTNSLADGLNSRVIVDVSSFSDSGVRKLGAMAYKLRGEMIVLNSLEEFKSAEKQLLIDAFGRNVILKALDNLTFLRDPESLLVFQLLTYCDLKRHKFYFWFAYPAVICSPQPVLVASRRLDEELSERQVVQLVTAYEVWRKEHSSAFFVIRITCDADEMIRINSLTDFRVRDRDTYLAFCDPSTHELYPGWPLRNMLFALAATVITESTLLRVVCFRERFSNGRRSCGHSLVLNIEVNSVRPAELTQFVGWEKFEDKLKPRIADLSTSLNPLKLAESAVDLNLKLMKWRLMPELDIGSIQKTKCLLVGSGTLGCNISRQLLAWGFRHITFIDNATVSMSNPVRQTLYTFEDAKNKKPKSHAASSALTAIFPGISSRGVQLDIPMPGHPVIFSVVNDYSVFPKNLDSDASNIDLCPQVQKAYLSCCNLKELICSHDVVFLLTDTRESRWLPSLLAHFYGKLIINVALGFDSYVVMRHGTKHPPGEKHDLDVSKHNLLVEENLQDSSIDQESHHRSVPGTELGCYFCNDIVGPTDSTHNRAMDQQCTVTRPGVSMIASAFAVELLVNLLHHPDKAMAPAMICNSASSYPYSLTNVPIIPHQIRGFLAQYSTIFPTSTAFKNCPACSDAVLDAFNRDGFIFLLNVFNDSNYLERTCGLTDLRHSAENNDVIALSDDEAWDP